MPVVQNKQMQSGRCDSFVVETDVHFPTDISILYDAARKFITLIAQWCGQHGLSDWRQHRSNVRRVKRLMRSAQNKKRIDGLWMQALSDDVTATELDGALMFCGSENCH